MKIALASVRIVNRDIRYNLSQMEYCVADAQKKGAELICFGETFLQGFDSLSWRFENDQAMAISADSNVFAEICYMSIEYGIDVLFGYVELDGDSLFSTCALISNGMLYHNYRRISKGWKEYTKTDEHYREGDTVEEWENSAKTKYAEQANKCCPNTLYINSICGCDALGGAAFFEKGTVRKELPINKEGLLFVEV